MRETTLGSMYAADTLANQRMFAALPERAQNRVLKPLMQQASKIVAEAERSEAPRSSGLMAAALGASGTRTYNTAGGSSKFFIAVGVRRGFRRIVQPKTRGGLRYLSQRRSDAAADGEVQNPVKYLHLVVGGRKAITATNRKVLFDPRSGRFFGRSVAAAGPNPFMERAFEKSRDAAEAVVTGQAPGMIESEAKNLNT